jgi:hypothetical protein
LHVCHADEQDMGRFSADPTKQHPLIQKGIVGGISYWISGTTQMTSSKNLTGMIRQLRKNLPPAFPVLTGGYLIHSHIGWLPPPSFYDMLSQSIELYDRNEIGGFFVFAGNALRTMNATEWKAYDLSARLSQSYFPWLGNATVTVTAADENDGEGLAQIRPAVAVEAAVVTVVWNDSSTTGVGAGTAVTRKQTSADGSISFGGWIGKSQLAKHGVFVSAAGYEDATATVQLKAGQTVSLSVKLKKKNEAASTQQLQQLSMQHVVTRGKGEQQILILRSNPNCVARGKCITVGPGTKYPEQNTMCLGDESGGGAWYCVNTGGRWGTMDHTFGPGSTFDSVCRFPHTHLILHTSLIHIFKRPTCATWPVCTFQ